MEDTALAFIIHAYLSYINIQDKYWDLATIQATTQKLHRKKSIFKAEFTL